MLILRRYSFMKNHLPFNLLLVAIISVAISPHSFSSTDYIWWEAEDYISGNFPKSGDFDPQTPEQAKNFILQTIKLI